MNPLVIFAERFVLAHVCKLEAFDIIFTKKIILCIWLLLLIPSFQKERRNVVGLFTAKTLDSYGGLDNFVQTIQSFFHETLNFVFVWRKVLIRPPSFRRHWPFSAFNTQIVHLHQILECYRASIAAIRPNSGKMVLRRQCERRFCSRHFAEIEEVRSFSLRVYNSLGLWRKGSGYAQNGRSLRAGCRKKNPFGNAICIAKQTTNYLRAVLTMRIDGKLVAKALFLILARQSFASASTFALSAVKIILISSLVLQAILSISSGSIF